MLVFKLQKELTKIHTEFGKAALTPTLKVRNKFEWTGAHPESVGDVKQLLRTRLFLGYSVYYGHDLNKTSIMMGKITMSSLQAYTQVSSQIHNASGCVFGVSDPSV